MKYVLLVAALAGVCALLLTACGGAAGSGSASSPGSASGSAGEETAYRKITAQEAKELMDAGGVTVVDVRTAEEYAAGHIPDALLVPNETIGDTQPAALPDQDAVLLVYCRSGRRSEDAARKLAALGYKTVYDFGGILDWPYDTVAGE